MFDHFKFLPYIKLATTPSAIFFAPENIPPPKIGLPKPERPLVFLHIPRYPRPQSPCTPSYQAHPMNLPVETFKDDLATRIFPMRFRRIGNPYAFLNEVGIIPILEYIYKGHLLLDVAEALNVSYTVLSTWAEQEGHLPAIEEAETVSAEGFLAAANRELRAARTSFELAKAKELVRQAQFMASKKNKGQYGDAQQMGSGASVSYVFNIGGAVSAPQLKDVVATVLPTTDASEAPKPLTFNMLEHLIDIEAPGIPPDIPIGSMDWGLNGAENDPNEPEMGPFYD